MKTVILILLFAITSQSLACITPTNCNGITPATCTSPCVNCGVCNTRCCLGFGREEEENRGRGSLFCRFNGRYDSKTESEVDEALYAVEKESFRVCDTDEDSGLTWPEVSACVENFGHLFTNLNMPSHGDFEQFDVNEDGKLFFEEWLETLKLD